MAFQQPQQRPRARPLSFSAPPQPAEQDAVPSPQRKRPLEDSEEWVLFSPGVAASTTQTQTTSTDRTPRTGGLSRFSDFGYLETAGRSAQTVDDEDLTCQGTEIDEDEEELDSLDDGLHAFHEPSLHGGSQRLEQSGETVLPTHDGLGAFPASSSAVQEQLWQFERYNPRRRRARRRPSIQRRIDVLEDAGEGSGLTEEQERTRRIEKWRLDQSRALLEEIERETRRQRRMSRVSAARSQAGSVAQEQMSSTTETTLLAVDEVAPRSVLEEAVESESFWQRFTRRVIRDLMGIDESILEVILGEALPADATQPTTAPNVSAMKTPEAGSLTPYPGQSWEHRLLERIARELGILVHQLSEHPGAFSTYARTQEAPLYAGLPNTSTSVFNFSRPHSGSTSTARTNMPSAGALFSPTVPVQPAAEPSDTSLWGIEEEPEPLETSMEKSADDEVLAKEYWEKDLDVKMVFNFLVTRFSSRTPPAARNDSIFSANALPTEAGSKSILANPLSARRAAMIRQHHPLVSRTESSINQASRRRDLLHRHHYHHQATAVGSSLLQRIPRFTARTGSSSCASQSTKKSRKTGSSRNYWDIGGSAASGPTACYE